MGQDGREKPEYGSWIPPEIDWNEPPDLFFLNVPISDRDLVELLAAGSICIKRRGTQTAQFTARELRSGRRFLLAQLEETIPDDSCLPPSPDDPEGDELLAFCHAVFLLPDKKELCLIMGNSPTFSVAVNGSAELKSAAERAWTAFKDALKAHQAAEQTQKQGDELFAQGKPELDNALFWARELLGPPRPTEPTVESFLDLLPVGVMYDVSSHSSVAWLQEAISCIAQSNCRPPRDGAYNGFVLRRAADPSKKAAIITWLPASGLPSYPELRWAVQAKLPSAFRTQRSNSISRPEFENSSIETVSGFSGIDDARLWDADNEPFFNENRYYERILEIKKEFRSKGFEALAWYQPYHSWTEEFWGIYFDARRLDDLSLWLHDDLRHHGVYVPYKCAGLLAFGITYEHELFHAHIEAIASWLEILTLRPQYLRYSDKVYSATFSKSTCLEEALANWSAWSWLQSESMRAVLEPAPGRVDAVVRAVENILDDSPDGYRHWRFGNDGLSWRKLGMQLIAAKGRQSALSGGLPVDGLLRGTLPFAFLRADVPLRFVGTGLIASTLQAHPATLNVIKKRELEKALKFHGYEANASEGKGSHQKWTGKDGRAFPVPSRDPVSYTVFKSFLEHFGITKAEYISRVRPNL